jgi:hypothetical protein
VLREEEIETRFGRMEGGSFIQLTHLPTGISRFTGPLAGRGSSIVVAEMLRAIECEIYEKGLVEFIVAPYPVKNRRLDVNQSRSGHSK